jgi:hypothetical protein
MKYFQKLKERQFKAHWKSEHFERGRQWLRCANQQVMNCSALLEKNSNAGKYGITSLFSSRWPSEPGGGRKMH